MTDVETNKSSETDTDKAGDDKESDSSDENKGEPDNESGPESDQKSNQKSDAASDSSSESSDSEEETTTGGLAKTSPIVEKGAIGGAGKWVPGKDVVFFGETEGEEQTEPFTVTNNTRLPVAFRFRTNHPEELRLHPTATGILEPKSEATLNLTWTDPRFLIDKSKVPKLLLQTCYLTDKDMNNKQLALDKVAWATITGTKMKVKLEKPPTDESKVKQVQVIIDEELIENTAKTTEVPWLYIILFIIVAFLMKDRNQTDRTTDRDRDW